MRKRTRTEVITADITPEVKKKIIDITDAQGISVAEWVRTVIDKELGVIPEEIKI